MSAELYEKFVSQLELKGYAKRSIDSYVKSVMQLQRFCNWFAPPESDSVSAG